MGIPWWNSQGRIDRHGGANENSFAFGENERECVRCVQGLSVIESSRALPDGMVTSMT